MKFSVLNVVCCLPAVTQASPAAPDSAGIKVRSIVRETAACEPSRIARSAVVAGDRPDVRKRLGGPATSETRKPAVSEQASYLADNRLSLTYEVWL